jgi:PAS domain S-box-containing protein
MDFAKLLGSVIESGASEIVLITDADIDSPSGPTILYATNGVVRSSGYQPNELVGNRLGMLFEERVMPEVLSVLRRAAAGRAPVTVDQVAKRRDGGQQWLELSTTPVFDERGQLTHFVRMSRDITARKNAERNREMTQRLLASVFGVIKDPLVVADEAGHVIMANTAVTRRLGWSIFDLMAKPASQLVAEADRDQLEALMRDGRALDQTRQLKCRLRQQPDATLAGELELTSCRQPSGETVHILALRPAPTITTADREWNLEMAVREAMGDDAKGAVVAGKLQLVGLARVKDDLGGRWAGMADRAFTVAERVIQRHLRPGDVFRRTKDGDYLVLFSHLSPTEAQFKAGAISAEIREKLTGELPELADVEVTSFAGRVEIGQESMASEESIVDAIERRLRAERDRVEAEATEVLARELRDGRAFIDTVVNEKGQRSPLMMARLPVAMREAASVLRSMGQEKYEIETESFLLANAGERILEGISSNQASLVVAPVRFATLTLPRDLEVWLRTVRALGEAAKQRIVAEITEIPPEVTATRLSDLAMRLTSMFKAIAFEIPLVDAAFQAKLPQSVKLATMEYRQISWSSLGEPVPAFHKLNRALDLRQRRLIVKNVPSATKRAALARTGVSLFLTPLA